MWRVISCALKIPSANSECYLKLAPETSSELKKNLGLVCITFCPLSCARDSLIFRRLTALLPCWRSCTCFWIGTCRQQPRRIEVGGSPIAGLSVRRRSRCGRASALLLLPLKICWMIWLFRLWIAVNLVMCIELCHNSVRLELGEAVAVPLRPCLCLALPAVHFQALLGTLSRLR